VTQLSHQWCDLLPERDFLTGWTGCGTERNGLSFSDYIAVNSVQLPARQPICSRHRDILYEMLMRVAMRRDFMTSGDPTALGVRRLTGGRDFTCRHAVGET